MIYTADFYKQNFESLQSTCCFTVFHATCKCDLVLVRFGSEVHKGVTLNSLEVKWKCACESK